VRTSSRRENEAQETGLWRYNPCLSRKPCNAAKLNDVRTESLPVLQTLSIVTSLLSLKKEIRGSGWGVGEIDVAVKHLADISTAPLVMPYRSKGELSN
jgi:hypothetical protein